MESIGLLWTCVAFIVLLSAYLLEDIISMSMADVSQYRSIQQLNRAFQRRRTKSAPEDRAKYDVAKTVRRSKFRRRR
ncbi:Fatty acid oxidation complex subunit alpha [Trichinella spiralis]|uniref:Fatty acid oxidation complex subunit alpha n=1 Tax=Trichinella spiralis TaxID=6334 RepID=A0ABR3KBF6_TRISP